MAGSIPPFSIDQATRVLGQAVRRIAPAWLAADRDDLVQNAMVRLLKASESEEWGDHGTSYMWKVAHNVVMDELRARRRRRESAMEDERMAATVAAGSGSQDPDRMEFRDAIRQALGRLSPPRRAAVLLYLLGHSLEESAQRLNWTTKQVDNQRYRGLAELRRILEDAGIRP